MNTYEIAYINGQEVRSKIYTNKDAFTKDFKAIKASKKPVMAQGPNKNGKHCQVIENGWNNDDVILTAVVKFDNDKEYAYSAGKHYFGMYEVTGRKGNILVSVKYQWRLIDEFRAELFEKGYDSPTSFESILVRKVASK